MIKVAFDYQIFCRQSYGGISRYFACLANHMLSQGAGVNIFAPYHRNHYLDSLSPHMVKGKHVGECAPGANRVMLHLNRIISRRDIQRYCPDILHETYFSAKPTASNRCPTIVTVCDMIPEIYPSLFKGQDATIQYKRAAIERADHIICISENTRKDLLALSNVSKERTSTIYLGFERMDKPATQDISTDFDEEFVLFVGNRLGYKNFSKLLEAFSASPRLKSDFDIIAFGGGRFNSTEQSAIRELGFREGQVKQVSGDDCMLAALYKAARALVFPSVYEGFGLPPLEAMAYGCPVISSNSSCMPEVIGDAAEYFSPLSTEDMMVALENVLYSELRIAELISLGKERSELFSWDKCAQDTLGVYEAVLSSS